MNEIILGTSDHILLFLMGVVLPLVAVFQSQPQLKGMVFNTSEKLQIYYGNGIFQWISTFAILALWWINDRPFRDLGLGWPKMEQTALLLLLIAVLLYVVDSWWELSSPQKIAETKQKWKENVPFLPDNWKEYRHFLFVAVTAGVCEEIIFRGFFIQYFLAWNENNSMGQWLSILIPAFMFSFGHLYQGHQAVVKTMIMAILFGWIFILTQSLWIPIIIHFLVDAISGYAAMRVLREEKE